MSFHSPMKYVRPFFLSIWLFLRCRIGGVQALRLASIVFLGFGLVSKSWADEKFWRVEIRQAQCLLDNLEAYQKSQHDPIIVFLKACPEVDRNKAIASLQQNTSSPSIPIVEGQETDEIIVFNRSELACLSKIALNREDKLVLIPKSLTCKP